MKITNYLWIQFKKTNLNSFETKKRLIFITLATTDSNETRRIHIRNEKVQIIFNTSQPITTPNNLSNPTFKNSLPSNIRISNIRTEKYILPRTRARLGKPRIKFQFPSRRFSHRRLDLSLVGAPTNTIVISRYFPSPSLARCVYIYIYERDGEELCSSRPNLSCLADKLLERRSLDSLFPRRWSRRRPPRLTKHRHNEVWHEKPVLVVVVVVVRTGKRTIPRKGEKVEGRFRHPTFRRLTGGGFDGGFPFYQTTTAPRGRNKAKHTRANKIGALDTREISDRIRIRCLQKEGWTNFKVVQSMLLWSRSIRGGGGC